MGKSKQKNRGLTERAIRSMPYELRLEYYEREKNKMFSQIKDLPAADVADAHRELAKKWWV